MTEVCFHAQFVLIVTHSGMERPCVCSFFLNSLHFPFCTGNMAEVHRLMTLVPKLKDVRVHLGQWKPRGPVGDDGRLPRAEVLQKAALWTSSQFASIRGALSSPPLQLEITQATDVMKVDVPGGGTSVWVIRNHTAMPAAAANVPLSAIVVDTRGMSSEEGDLMTRMPGRSKFGSLPALIFGGLAEVEEARRGILRACGSQWAGEARPLDVYTNEASAQYTYMKRRMLCLVPTGSTLSRVPPVANISHCSSLNMGWAVMVGLLRFLWHKQAASADQPQVEWLYVLSDDDVLPAMLSQCLETCPSIVFCQLHERSSLSDVADRIADNMKTAQDMRHIDWAGVVDRWSKMQPLFTSGAQSSAGGESDTSSSSGDSGPTRDAVPKPSPKAAAKRPPKKVAKPRPPAKVKPDALVRATSSQAAGTSSQPASRVEVPAAVASPSRDVESARVKEKERLREREREREREAQREADRDRERRRERDRQEREDQERRRREEERERDRARERRERERDREAERHHVRRRDSSDSHGDSRSSTGSRGNELQRRLGNTGYRSRR